MFILGVRALTESREDWVDESVRHGICKSAAPSNSGFAPLVKALCSLFRVWCYLSLKLEVLERPQ